MFFKLIIQTEFQPTEVKLIFRPPLLVKFRPSKFDLCEVLLVVLDFLVTSTDAKSALQIYSDSTARYSISYKSSDGDTTSYFPRRNAMPTE